jgi:FdhD protein
VHLVGLFERYTHGYVAVLIVEDVGRHNALDKVIGYGLTRGIAFEKTFVACTGRISSEMALKCAIANIPVIASRGATTSLAIELAEKTGLCIIGFVRGERMNVYTNPERVVREKEES